MERGEIPSLLEFNIMAKFVQRIPGGVDTSIEPLEIVFETTEELIESEYVQRFVTMKGHEALVVEDNVLMAISDEGYHWWALGYIDDMSAVNFPQWEGAKYREPEFVEGMDEDLEEARKNFTPEDLSGGLHNVQVPPSFAEQEAINAARAAEFITINDELGEIPHKTDGISVTFTPEELVFLTQVLEQFASSTCCVVPYADKELNMNLYTQQGLVRQLRDNVDATLDQYVRVRPFTPFLIPWFNRIGKKSVREGKE